MSMKFTKVASDAFQKIQLNAGILLSDFDPSTASVNTASILWATTGGTSFTATPNYTDFGEDIDNVPKNTMELKKLEDWTVTMSGTAVTIDTNAVKVQLGAADIDSTDSTKVAPRGELSQSDFDDYWWVGDYSDQNGAQNGGFIAINIKNALSTGGFQLQTGDKTKGNFSFELTGHYSIADDEMTPPFDVYVKAGTAE